MSRFDAIFLHNVVDYNRSADLPEVPNFSHLQKRLSDAVNEALQEEAYQTESNLRDIASDYDFDDSLGEYVDRSADAIQELHEVIRDANDLLSHWDPENMDRQAMIDFVEKLKDELEEGLPNSYHLNHMIKEAWFHHLANYGVGSYDFLRQVFMIYQPDDTYRGSVFCNSEGRIEIRACSKGVLRFDMTWRPGSLVFTSDERISLKGAEDKPNFVMKLWEFKNYFVDFMRPTEDEIALFDVLHPGADWTVLRCLRNYEQRSKEGGECSS